jgi:hypothetical protein
VKNRFQNLPFKFNLQRYIAAEASGAEADSRVSRAEVGG